MTWLEVLSGLMFFGGVALVAGYRRQWRVPKQEPAPPPLEFSEHFFAEYDSEDDDGQPWDIYSLYQTIFSVNPGSLFSCSTREDAIALMKRLDPVEAERIASAKGSA